MRRQESEQTILKLLHWIAKEVVAFKQPGGGFGGVFGQIYPLHGRALVERVSVGAPHGKSTLLGDGSVASLTQHK